MDSCTEGEQETFFESFEVIPSSGSSENESGGEEDHKPAPKTMGRASTDIHPVSFSRYEVWKSDSGSLFERRQRLFMQMGLSQEDIGKGTNPFTSKIMPSDQILVETLPSNTVELVNTSDGMKGALGDDGLTSFQLFENKIHEVEDCSIRSDHGQTREQHTDASSATLKSASSGLSRGDSIRERVSNQLSSQNHDFVQDFVSLDGDGSDYVIRYDSRLPLSGSVAVEMCQDAELVCRIKDLDTGKEFVVNEVGKDGSWNKVKELYTGRELTVEEFESSLGLSPIVQEVMKREMASDDRGRTDIELDIISGNEKKKRAWFQVIREFVNHSRDKGNHKSGSNSRVVSMEKSGRRSSSESSDSREALPQLAKRVKVHAHRKSVKEFSDLYLRQEFRAHQGAIWTMKFSRDGSLLASAGQDKVVRVWEVYDYDGLARTSSHNSGDSCLLMEIKGGDNLLHCPSHLKGSVKSTSRRTAASSSRTPFFLSEKPKRAFNGHIEDVLDLSWSHSQFLLSSSMDKTVRLWNVVSGECSRIFAHSDYVTCIHFNPLDDGYFISGSLDGKVRIWSIKGHKVVDWVDLCEMVTAACYTHNGQGAVVGSYKGTCHFYKTSDSKLQFDTKFQVRRKKKRRSPGKKITGFQFIPGDESKILITSSDSRIRVYDGNNVSSKYKGLRNNNSQIAASVSGNGMYIICASEDSRVCIWKYRDCSSQKQKALPVSYEDFLVQHVSIAIPWPGCKSFGEKSNDRSSLASEKVINIPETNLEGTGCSGSSTVEKTLNPDLNTNCELSSYRSVHGDSVQKNIKPTETASGKSSCLEQKQPLNCEEEGSCSSGGASVTSPMLNSYLEDCCSVLSKVGADHLSFGEVRGSATWPEENGLQKAVCDDVEKGDVNAAEDLTDQKCSATTSTAWDLVIVTAGLEGDIQVFQNQSLLG